MKCNQISKIFHIPALIYNFGTLILKKKLCNTALTVTDRCMNNYCLFQSISNCVTLLLPLVESYRVLQIESPKLMLFSKQHFVTVYTFPVIIIAYHIMEPTSLLQSLIIKLNKTKKRKTGPIDDALP